jgi:hypothetical protein
MAISDKNIVITPNVSGVLDNQPKIVFTGADSSIGDSAAITLTARPENSGTLSFTGDAGQLFSITNSLSGTLFAVSDISGIPSLEIHENGIVKLAEYSGRVLVGTDSDDSSSLLQIAGNVRATAYYGDGSNLTGISGGGGVTVQDEGSPLTTTATTLNFVGSGVAATGTGATKTITISGGGGTFASYTSTATLTAGETALANTSGGAFTLTLPASPSTNDQIIILDATGNFGTNNLTVGRNGNTIQGDASDLVCDIDNVAIRLHYTGSDWRVYAILGATGGDVATLTGTETLTNKTLTNPTINNYTEGTVAIGTVGASHTFNLTSGTLQTATLTASTATTFTMPTASSGKSFILVLSQPAVTGNGTATFTGVYFTGGTAPTITAAAGSIDILSFVSDGTNWYGTATQDYQ